MSKKKHVVTGSYFHRDYNTPVWYTDLLDLDRTIQNRPLLVSLSWRANTSRQRVDKMNDEARLRGYLLYSHKHSQRILECRYVNNYIGVLRFASSFMLCIS